MTEVALRQAAATRQLARRLDRVWLLILAIAGLTALRDPDRAGEVFAIGAGAFAGTAPFIAVAVLSIAWLKASGAETMIARAFEGRGARRCRRCWRSGWPRR